jgi:hypothetical protein
MGDADAEAFKVVNLLKNGQGGLDWAGLPFVAAWLGIADIDGLMERLAVILTYHRNKDD